PLVNGVGELHSTTLEVTMDSFFSGVQLHFTIDHPFLVRFSRKKFYSLILPATRENCNRFS
ncbi:hypothetical protein, partial [Hominenteromicrobium sp.]|uniref:hypothetical protein n=1 Tax=Hominenteromicrobium sp. TaxID=3073581 RepID=UPI003AF6CDDB